MHRTLRYTTLLGTALLAFGCSDATAPDPSATHGTVVVPPSFAASDATLQRIARAVAVALASEDARLEVRDAMRDSPWNSHKLLLHEFLASPGGRAFTDRAAAAAGQSRAQFLAAVASLPALDFYLPRREQRQTWSGTAGVVVGAALNPEGGVVHRFDARGLPLSGAGDGDAPLMALIPAESKAPRQNPQPRGRGEVVEARGDGQRAESFRWIEPNGKVIVADMAEIRAGRDSRFTMNVSGPTPGITRVQCISSGIVDGGPWMAGNVELELHARFYAPDGTLAGTGIYTDHEFPEPGLVPASECPDAPLISRVLPDRSNAYIFVEMWEDDCDCFGNEDDFYGGRRFDWFEREQFVDYPDGANKVMLNWEPVPPSVQTSVNVASTVAMAGGMVTINAYAVDQYGFHMPGAVSSWSVSDPYILDVSGASANDATLSAYQAGQAEVYATIGGFTGTGYVDVWQPAGPGGCLQLPCPGSGPGLTNQSPTP